MLIGSPIHSPVRSPIILPYQGKWVGGFRYEVDFVAGTAIGGTQPYGNNTNDGRLFRDPTNVVASFCPPNADGTGTLVSVASSGIRRTAAGQWAYPSFTNRLLWNRDWTNAAWTKTNMTATKDQTGADGTANAATRLTATAANATISQTITLASGQVVGSLDIKRVTGSGSIDLSVDGAAFTTLTGLTSSYQLKFITQAAVTNPVVTLRIVTSGDEVAVDFGHLITPANSMNIPKQERVATTSSTVLNSQSRPSADIADAAPNALITVARGPHAFYWQGRSERGNGSGPITGATNLFCSVIANNAVTYAVGGGTAQSADSAFKVGLNQVNKIAGYATSGGLVKLCVNGGTVVSATGATFDAAMDHWDLSTNGAGSRSIYGVTEKFKMGSGVTFTDAELVTMTT